jgi:hypothetical protein
MMAQGDVEAPPDAYACCQGRRRHHPSAFAGSLHSVFSVGRRRFEVRDLDVRWKFDDARRSISQACRGGARRRQLHLRAHCRVRSFSMAPITLPAALGAPGLPCGRCKVRPCAKAVMDPARSIASMGSGTD